MCLVCPILHTYVEMLSPASEPAVLHWGDEVVNLYLVSLEIQPWWSGLLTRTASDLVGHAKILLYCTEYNRPSTAWKILCLISFHFLSSWHKFDDIDNVQVRFEGTIHQLYWLPMFLFAHYFCVFELHIPLEQVAFYYSQRVRGHIAMLRLLVQHWTDKGDWG